MKVPAILGMVLRNQKGFVVILQAHIELKEENAPGLLLP